jgi:prepilin-type N-terminal cleavage/methylation domain-containing protein
MISNINLKKAFSLIEISLVVLIVGILISGVSLGVDLYNDFRLATARNLTINSRVGRIQDLVSWYETTNQNVFSKGTLAFEDLNIIEENQAINRWKDSNSKSFIKLDAAQTSSGSQPKIIFDKATSLPIVRFDSGKFLNLPNGTVPYGNEPYTVIFVSKIDANCNCPVLTSGDGSSNTKNSNFFEYRNDDRILNVWDAWQQGLWSFNGVIAINKFQMFSFTYDQSKINIYINKNYHTRATGDNIEAYTKSRTSLPTNNFIGKRSSLDFIGSIAEIIIFNRSLSNNEREDIENYLSKKWSIKLGSK